jgi:surfeit locus 1 family protein
VPKRFILLALCLIVAAFCVRLGVWQLDRRAQRRAANEQARAGLTLPPIEIDSFAGADALERFRRVRVAGVFDYTREVVISPRVRNGSPGVHVVTALARAGTDTIIPVVRGWVYAPDAVTVELERWREGDSARVEGYVIALDTTGADDAASARESRALRRLDRTRLAERFGAPVTSYYITMTGPSGDRASTPARLTDPVLAEGPHLSYAVQWFLFAVIFGAGGTLVVLRGAA